MERDGMGWYGTGWWWPSYFKCRETLCSCRRVVTAKKNETGQRNWGKITMTRQRNCGKDNCGKAKELWQGKGIVARQRNCGKGIVTYIETKEWRQRNCDKSKELWQGNYDKAKELWQRKCDKAKKLRSVATSRNCASCFSYFAHALFFTLYRFGACLGGIADN